MRLQVLFLDFNAYFASVEQQLRPELRGKPVVVTPVKAETTCCIAVSQEARVAGVQRGMRVAEARRVCRGLRVVEARPPVYVELHHEIVKIVDRCLPVEKVLSIDEMMCALPERFQPRAQAEAAARQIKQALAEGIGPFVRCSIGLAPNRLLAKTACGMQKPDGLTVIEGHELPGRLHPLKLRDFHGIGEKMEARLQRAGIHTVEQLCAAARGKLRRIWGSVEGERVHDALRGLPVAEIETQKCLVSHSHVLAPAEREPAQARAILHQLLQKAAARLRSIGHYARGLQMFIEYRRSGGCEAQITFCETQSTREFLHALEQLWQQRPTRAEPLVMVGVSLFNLVAEQNRTPSLFENRQTQRSAALEQAVDAINQRWGRNTIYFAGAHTARDASPMRIAFHFIPELETPEPARLRSSAMARQCSRGHGT